MGNGVCQKCKTEKNNANFYANGGRIFIICADCEREGTAGSLDNRPQRELIYVNGQFASVPKGSGKPMTSGQFLTSTSNSSEKPFPILPTNY